jgi:drug/metabolite transporter (DMT)-like permease
MDKITTPHTTTSEPLPGASARWGLGLTDVLLLGVIVVWGTNFVVLKRALQELSPYTVNAIRFSISSAFLLAIISRRQATGPLLRRDTLRVLVAGITGFGVGQVCMLLGLSLSPASQAALLAATMPIFVALLSHLAGMERLSPRGWIGIGLCFAGIVLVVGGPSGANRLQAMLGGLLSLLSALGWAISMVITAPVLRRSSVSRVSAATTVTGTLILILIAIPAMLQERWSGVTPVSWAGLVFSGVLSLAIGTVIWNRGVRVIGAPRTAIYANLTPVVAAATGWLFLNERLTLLQFAGAAIILSGLYVVRTARVR